MARKHEFNEDGSIKVVKVPVVDRNYFLSIRNTLCEQKQNFTYTSSGSINSIIYDGREFVSVDLSQAGGRGHHLNKLFKLDIDDWLDQNADIMQPYGVDYKEQMFNVGAIEKNIGLPKLAIDIDDCYWRTAYQLGYITNKTFIKGLQKKEWKVGRNACIGSLRKSTSMVPFVSGKPNYAMKTPIKSRVEYQYIRNHIIGHVYQMFLKLYEEIEQDFYMFLTDCVFTDHKHRRYVEDFFSARGYKVKIKPVEFLYLDRHNRKIGWFDFEASKKDKAGKVTGKGVEKYYMYSNSQMVDGIFGKSYMKL